MTFPNLLLTLIVRPYPDDCVEEICARHGVEAINVLGVCQGAVFSTCYAALHPKRVRNLPGPLTGFMFLMMNPVMNMTKYTSDLVDLLGDDKKLLNFLHMETWIADRPDNPGETVRQWLKDLYKDNKLVRNELVLGGRRVDLRNITMPVLNVYAQGDVIIPNACSISENVRFGTSDYTELAVPGGHIGTFVGGKAQAILAPRIAEWLKARI